MFDPLNEQCRIEFYLQRDGLEGAIAAAKQIVRVYLQASLATRKKGSRNHPYRIKYIEGAYSARHLLRTMLRTAQ